MQTSTIGLILVKNNSEDAEAVAKTGSAQTEQNKAPQKVVPDQQLFAMLWALSWWELAQLSLMAAIALFATVSLFTCSCSIGSSGSSSSSIGACIAVPNPLSVLMSLI